jgi:hypothetical protein
MKNTLAFTQKISASPHSFEELLDRATTYMNAMIDSLHTIECTDYLIQIMRIRHSRPLSISAWTYLRVLLRFPI